MKTIGIGSVGVVIALFLSGCSASDGQQTADGGQQAGGSCEGAVIGDSIPQASDPGLSLTHNGFLKEAESRGAEVLAADANLDLNKQLSDVDGFTQRKMDAITVWPMDGTAIRPALQRAEEAGTLIVTHQTPESVDSATNMQFDDRGAGAALATYLAEKLGKGAKVAAIVGPQQVESFRNMAEGFAEGAADAGLEVVETYENSALSPQKSAEITEQLKALYGADLKGIFDAINVTALAVATVRGDDFQPLIVTYEGNEETRQAIQDDKIAATVYVGNTLMGRAKGWVVCEALAGETFPDQIEVPYLIIDKENVGALPTEDEQLEVELSFELESVGSGERLVYKGIDLPESALTSKAGE
ncbi:ribose-binding protein [Rhodoglobus vestalii]|uniref:Ribose-binding protein n=1 Tax=Rhodoglobus vestalii TaxID=193384 RepID=A0A8H2PU41_9MICO|nr:sugar ABC transporter substrate-binding protein [Rhodoglobus vestalii]TQO20061.1 ribose-binding protein [Rhodoglobus vestalii]